MHVNLESHFQSSSILEGSYSSRLAAAVCMTAESSHLTITGHLAQILQVSEISLSILIAIGLAKEFSPAIVAHAPRQLEEDNARPEGISLARNNDVNPLLEFLGSKRIVSDSGNSRRSRKRESPRFLKESPAIGVGIGLCRLIPLSYIFEQIILYGCVSILSCKLGF